MERISFTALEIDYSANFCKAFAYFAPECRQAGLPDLKTGLIKNIRYDLQR